MSDLPPLAISAASFCRAPPRQASRRGLFVSNARNSTNCPYRDELRSEPWTWFSILIRYAYYEDYPDKLLDIPYLITFATACLAVSLIAERLARRVLLSK